MENTVEVSVVIPCWNVQEWVPRCLDEVLAALPASAEAIAVDDGSTDGTLAVLRERAAADRRLRVIAAPHRGVSAARNAALDAAVGEWVFFVDPDDGVEPGFFSEMLGAVRRDGADCCVCAFAGAGLKGDYRFRTNGEIVAGYLSRVIGYSFDDVRAWYRGRPLFANREMAAVWRFVYRRALLVANGVRFDESVELYEDAMFNAEALVAARTMTCVDLPLYRVTARDSGAMRSVPRDGIRFCRNKLALLAARRRVDARAGGRLAPLYAASCVFSALEILSYVARGRVPRREGVAILRAYLADGAVSHALRDFPLSVRRPLVALAVLCLRLVARRVARSRGF